MSELAPFPSIKMDHLEIANLVHKRPDNVKRTIESLVDAGIISHPQIEDGISGANGLPQSVGKLAVCDVNSLAAAQQVRIKRARCDQTFTSGESVEPRPRRLRSCSPGAPRVATRPP